MICWATARFSRTSGSNSRSRSDGSLTAGSRRSSASSAPVPGANTEDFMNESLELPGDGWALCGIKFRGLDLRLPFVDLVGSRTLIRSVTDTQQGFHYHQSALMHRLEKKACMS